MKKKLFKIALLNFVFNFSFIGFATPNSDDKPLKGNANIVGYIDFSKLPVEYHGFRGNANICNLIDKDRMTDTDREFNRQYYNYIISEMKKESILKKAILDDDTFEIEGDVFSREMVINLLLSSVIFQNSEIEIEGQNFDRSLVVRCVFDSLRNYSGLFYSKRIDKSDWSYYLSEKYPHLEYEKEEIYDIAQILLFSRVLSASTIENEIHQLKNTKRLY